MSLTWGNVKPPRGARLDWSHPMNRGILADWLFNENGGSPFDLVSRNKAAQPSTGALAWVGSTRGIALSSTAGSKGLTASPVTYGKNGSLYIQAFNQTTSAGAYLCDSVGSRYLLYRTTDAFNNFGFYINGVAISDVGTAVAPGPLANLFSLSAWTDVVIAWTQTPPTQKFYKNGSLFASFTVAISQGVPTAQNLGIRFNGIQPWIGMLSRFSAMSRAISATEVAALSARPYQMIAPVIPDTIYYSFGAQVRFRRSPVGSYLTGGL